VGKLRFPPPNSPLSFRDFPTQGRDPATGKFGKVDAARGELKKNTTYEKEKNMSLREFDNYEAHGITGFPRRFLEDADIQRIIAKDAALTTTSNQGVPAWMTLYTHPDVIKILVQKRAAEQIFSPSRTGSYGDKTAQFPIVEYTGDVAPYADYSAEGRSGYNVNYPKREAFYFQNYSEWGDMEMAVMSKGRIQAAAEKQAAAALAIKIAHNRIWFYGVAGLDNFGILNDPNLSTPITPTTGTAGDTWDEKTTKEIYADVLSLFTKLNQQAGANLRDGWTMADKLILCISNLVAPALHKATDFNISALDMIKKSFPAIELVTAPEYSTKGGELVQLIAPEVFGQSTGLLGYTELMKIHGVVRRESSFREKNSASNFGAVILQPFAVAQMLGV
jgi:hypothetical protein